MNKILKLTAAALMAVFITNYSIADNEGISIGFWGSSMDFDSKGKETQQDFDVNTTTVQKSVDVGSIFIEYAGDYGAIGVEYYPGDATIGSGTRTDDCVCGSDTSDDTTSTVYQASAQVSHVKTFYIEPMMKLNDTFGIYGKVGVTSMHVNTLESIAGGTDDSSYPDKDIIGAMYGIGVKARHASGIFMKVEASATNFQTFKVESPTGNKGSIEADVDLEAVRFAIGYTF